MATVTTQKISVNLVLRNAEDDGSRFRISLGQINKDAFDADKALVIKNLLAPCLTKVIELVEKTEVSFIEASA